MNRRFVHWREFVTAVVFGALFIVCGVSAAQAQSVAYAADVYAPVEVGGCGHTGGCQCDCGCAVESGACPPAPCWNPCPWYVTVSGGWSQRETVHEVTNAATFLDFDDGFCVNVGLGHRFGDFRVEAEYRFVNNEIDVAGAGIPGVGNLVSDADGNVSLRAFMANLYYDLPLGYLPIRPYCGAGIGIYQSEINSLFPQFFNQLGLGTSGLNTTSDFPLAYQFMGGVSVDVTPKCQAFVGYRYFKGEELEFAAAPFGPFQPDGAETHSLEGGLRIGF
jgi:opacity protein-like surface antigen